MTSPVLSLPSSSVPCSSWGRVAGTEESQPSMPRMVLPQGRVSEACAPPQLVGLGVAYLVAGSPGWTSSSPACLAIGGGTFGKPLQARVGVCFSSATQTLLVTIVPECGFSKTYSLQIPRAAQSESSV